MSSKNSVDMINGPLWGKVFKFSVTYMFMAVLQELYSAADVMVVGRYAGEAALAGVGTCTVLVNLFLNFILGLSSGVTIVIGQAIGANNNGIKKASHTAIALAVYGGLIISMVCLLFTNQLLNLIDVPGNVIPEASAYLRVRACGYIPALVYNFGSGILRAKGDTKRPMYIVLVSGLINVLLNLVFVCVFNMGAAGVALATILSQIFTAMAVMYILCHETDQTKIFIRQIRLYKEPFLKIVKYGVPSGIQSTVYSVSNIIVQSSVNSFGSDAIAGSSAGTSITNFYQVMVNSLYQAAIVFVSQNFGAAKFDRIKKTVFICLTYVCVLWGIQSVVTFFFNEKLLSLYSPDNSVVVQWGVRKLSIVGYSYGILGMMNVMSGTLRGMGASFINMITSIIGVCGIRIIWIVTVFASMRTFESLYWCYPISWFGTGILHMIMVIHTFKKEKRLACKDIRTV